jgi:hypothetical protein
MKKIICLLVACSSVFAACPKVIPVNCLTECDLNEIMQGKQPNTAIEFAENTILPVQFFLNGDLVNLVAGNYGAVQVKQPFFARYVNNNLIMSTNLKEWRPFVEFITGNASLSLSIQNGGPTIMCGAEINRN